jgi:ATPase subunit of ABC transporter with duplicated ATPase domains
VPAPSPQPSTATLTARHLRVDRGSRTILDDVSLTVGPRTRLGVVGANGVGKSTLLRVLAGLKRHDAGRIERRPASATVGYLHQQRHRSSETVRTLLHRRTGVADADHELTAAADSLAAGEADASARYEAALERWTTLGAADLDARIDDVSGELRLAAAALDQRTDSLSGGQLARAELAVILLSRFDLTLLDEPTNDLDFDGLARLEAFVSARAGGLVIVSHDRAFLDRTVSSVLELDEHDHKARLYNGGYAAYLDEHETARRHAEEAFEEYDTKRRELDDRARRERQWATSGASREKKQPRDNDKAQRGFRIDRTERLAARARMTQRAVERLAPVDKPWIGWDLRFSIDEAPRSGAVAARLEKAVVQRGDFTLGPVDLEIAWAERVALTGPNGSGKSTLLDALLGRLPLTAGRRYLGPSIVVGELGQERTAFAGADTLLEAFLASSGLLVADARSLLAKFGLGADQVARPASTLSPGERTRAELAGFAAVGVNLLVLDEPTNHLDLPAIEQLEQALGAFSGTLLLVSHDRRLLEHVALTRRIELPSSAPGDGSEH